MIGMRKSNQRVSDHDEGRRRRRASWQVLQPGLEQARAAVLRSQRGPSWVAGEGVAHKPAQGRDERRDPFCAVPCRAWPQAQERVRDVIQRDPWLRLM